MILRSYTPIGWSGIVYNCNISESELNWVHFETHGCLPVQWDFGVVTTTRVGERSCWKYNGNSTGTLFEYENNV